MTKILVRDLLAQPNSHWWDDTSTSATETRDDILPRAAQQGYAWLEETYGDDMDGWSWGKLNTATFENQSLGQSGIGLIRAIFNRGPIPSSGGSDIVNATGWSFDEPASVTSLPSERMILDLADWQQSLSMHTTGQSGHPFHKRYGDMIRPWRDIENHTMHWERPAIEADAEGVLRLEP